MPDIPLAEEALRRVLAVVDRTAELATELATTLRMRPDDAAVRAAAIPLGVDVGAFGHADFEAVARHLEPLDQLIAAVAPDAGGMRWRYLDESVLFRCEAEVGTPFDEFTARVDISRVIGLTGGYLAGRTEVLARDATGRAIRQLERSISRAPGWIPRLLRPGRRAYLPTGPMGRLVNRNRKLHIAADRSNPGS
ncbi:MULTISPECIES: hypothetical protein [unclassified Streptomyces]|uniref:hypothetical protein n=1 Tax=unclassified Streptomyces TaxID=2593676 RepID=UPI002E2C0581|nr:hypothetical protein [Streptomyces sp. NBC_01439]